MFDIGFSELLVIAIVALIVIGPERLPKVARTLGHLFGRMQRYVNDVKADISREMELEELRKLQSSVEDAARSIQSSVNKEISETESALNKVAQDALPAPDYPDTAAMPASTGEHPAQQLDLALESKADSLPHERGDAKPGDGDARQSAQAPPEKQA
jgi:sec-independent protein translocase protein TatB